MKCNPLGSQGTNHSPRGVLGKGNFLLSKSICNKQSNLIRLGIIINRFDKLQSDLTK
jgi:hypothetical protein